MADRAHEKPREAPLWLTTMTDMNMLLLIFFIALFSMGLMDRPYHYRTEQALQGMARAGKVDQSAGASVVKPEERAAFSLDQMLAAQVGEMAQANVRGHYVKVARTGEGAVITIGGEVAPFAEGSYELRPEHREVIAEVRRWLRGKLNVIVVRGHTAGNWQDSVVLEAGRVRPFGPEDLARDDRASIADPWLLAALRANAVRAELTRPDADPRVDERRVRVRGDAFAAPVASSSDERVRHENRRVEIVVTVERFPE